MVDLDESEKEKGFEGENGRWAIPEVLAVFSISLGAFICQFHESRIASDIDVSPWTHSKGITISRSFNSCFKSMGDP